LIDLAALNGLPEDEAREALLACCGSRRWAAAMAAHRPFADLAAVERAADEAWWALGADDWREAFAAHPRIGERAPGAGRAAAWSAREQAGTEDAAAEVRAALARTNRDYEARFGHLFIVCASGKTPAEMLALLEARLGADPRAELDTAAGEQAAITRLRLHRLLGEGQPPR